MDITNRTSIVRSFRESKISGIYYRGKKLICKMLSSNKKIYVNIGGGRFAGRNWKVLDYIEGWYQHDKRFVDINFNLSSRDKFPLADNSVEMFYCSHVLEHIPEEYTGHIINEIYRCLKAGGAVRIVAPDIDLAYEAYGHNRVDFFMHYSGANLEEKFLDFFATELKQKVESGEFRSNFQKLPQEEFLEFYRKKTNGPKQGQSPGNHINFLNYRKLKRVLERAGFRNIYRSSRQNSRFREMRGRHFDSTYPEMSLFVESVK